MSRLEVVKVTEDDAAQQAAKQQEATARAQAQQAVATTMLMTALKALSQRFVIALANLFTLLTAGSAFSLWMFSLQEITTLKIVACSLYSIFVLALNAYGRR